MFTCRKLPCETRRNHYTTLKKMKRKKNGSQKNIYMCAPFGTVSVLRTE